MEHEDQAWGPTQPEMGHRNAAAPEHSTAVKRVLDRAGLLAASAHSSRDVITPQLLLLALLDFAQEDSFHDSETLRFIRRHLPDSGARFSMERTRILRDAGCESRATDRKPGLSETARRTLQLSRFLAGELPSQATIRLRHLTMALLIQPPYSSDTTVHTTLRRFGVDLHQFVSDCPE